MGKTKVKESKKPLTLSKVVVYILLILLAITIIIPVGWVFVASVKQNSEFYGSPYVVVGTEPINPEIIVEKLSAKRERCRPGSFRRSRPTILLVTI